MAMMANYGHIVQRILSAFGPVVISVVLSELSLDLLLVYHAYIKFSLIKTECKCCNNFKVSYVLN